MSWQAVVCVMDCEESNLLGGECLEGRDMFNSVRMFSAGGCVCVSAGVETVCIRSTYQRVLGQFWN